MELMGSHVSANHHLLEELVRWRWILAALTLATMMLLVLLLPIIEISSAHVLLGLREGFAMKTSMNVLKTILVVMVELASTRKEAILANAEKGMKAVIV